MTASPKANLRPVNTLLLTSSSVLILSTLSSCIRHIISFCSQRMSPGYIIYYLTLLQILTSLISAPPLLPVTDSNSENRRKVCQFIKHACLNWERNELGSLRDTRRIRLKVGRAANAGEMIMSNLYVQWRRRGQGWPRGWPAQARSLYSLTAA